MKAIETEYKGYRFRSRLEARWAVFFDACGVKWEYEPEGFDLGDGIYYLPDFLLHDVSTREYHGYVEDIYVEVKGRMTDDDVEKISRFNCSSPILLVGNIPDGESFMGKGGIMDNILDVAYDHYKYSVAFYNFCSIDCDEYAAFPGVDKEGNFVLFGGDYLDTLDSRKTLNAYREARQARFEHRDGKVFSMKMIDILTAPNGVNIDVWETKNPVGRFVKAARIYSAFTRLNASMTSTHPIIRAADTIGAKYYRFANPRLSGGDSYRTKSYCFFVEDVPKILAQYIELHWNAKAPKQVQYNKAAQELRQWFKSLSI